MKTPILAAVGILGGLLTQSVAAQSGVTNDLWDVNSGTTVTARSPLNCYFGNCSRPADARDMFGGMFADWPLELGTVIFADGNAPGFVHFVEWRTANPVTVRSFKLYAAGDSVPNTNYRQFRSFVLKAKSPGTNIFDLTLFTFTPTHPYTFVDPSTALLLASDVRPTTAQEFRVEFVTWEGAPTAVNGPRVLELDGFSEFIGPKSSLRVSEIEVSWLSAPGVLYQVEYSTEMAPGTWFSLGASMQGTGGTMLVTDKVTNGSPRRFYRVRPLG